MDIPTAEAALSAARAKRLKEIVKRVHAGDSFTDIARDLGVSRERVRQLWFRAMAGRGK